MQMSAGAYLRDGSSRLYINKKKPIFQKQPPRRVFFQEQPFYNFPGGSYYLFVEPTYFFPGGSNVLRTDTNFPGGFIETDMFFQGRSLASIFSSNGYSFSKKPYLVLEHMLFFRKPLCLEQIGIFQEGTPVEQIFQQ